MGQERYIALWVLAAGLFCSNGATEELSARREIPEELLLRTADVKLPYGFKVCTINEPTFQMCLLHAAEHNLRLLTNGYTGFKLPPLNPLYLGTIAFELNHEPFFSVVVEQKDLQVDYDFENFIDVRLDEDRRVFSLQALFREMHVRGEHATMGESRFGPINGHGPINTTLKHLMVKVDMYYSLYLRNGREYMHVDRLKVNLEPDHMYVEFEGVLPKPYNHHTLATVLNRDWERYFRPALPEIEEQLGTILKKIVEGLFYHVPFRTFFPE